MRMQKKLKNLAGMSVVSDRGCLRCQNEERTPVFYNLDVNLKCQTFSSKTKGLHVENILVNSVLHCTFCI